MVLKPKPKVQLNPNLKSFWQTQADIKVLKGGRISSKTWDAAGLAIWLASKYCLTFLCIRQFQNRIEDSVYSVLKGQAERFGIAHEFQFLKNKIKHKKTGTVFSFFGMNKNTAEIKGFEGADVCWIEESEGLTSTQWDIIDPTLRKEGCECWILYNPYLVTSFVERFKHDPDNGVIVRHINYDENPFVSATSLRKIERMKKDDYDRYCHIYLGQPKTEDDTQKILPYAWLKKCVGAFGQYKDQIDDSRIHGGLDVAESEDGDKNSFAARYGPILDAVHRWKPDSTKGPAPKAQRYAMEYGVSKLYYDAGGVGAPLKRDFAAFTPYGSKETISYIPFLFGGTVNGKDKPFIKSGRKNTISNGAYFSRINAQAWWNLRMKAENTIQLLEGEDIDPHDCLFINPDIEDIDDLLFQLSTATYEEGKQGKITIDKKGGGTSSPDMADSVVMCFLYDIRKGLRA